MEVKNVAEKDFELEVLKAEETVLVDIWAPWCGPCQMLGPIVEEAAKEVPDVKVVKVNADNAPSICQNYRIMSIPALLVFKNGEEVNRSIGLISKEEVLELVR